MWNIVVCDQDESFGEQVGMELFKFYSSRDFDVNIRIYPSVSPNVSPLILQSVTPLHLIVLNTRYDGRQACALVKQILDFHPRAHIFFLSEHDEDIFDAVKYHPYAFIRKQVWETELKDALNNLWEAEHKGRYVYLRQNRRDIALLIDEIMYLESYGHYVIFHCRGGITYRTREKLPFYQEKLKSFYFIQPSKGYLVNCAYIDSCKNSILLTNGEIIWCARTRYREAMDDYAKYLHEMKCND